MPVQHFAIHRMHDAAFAGHHQPDDPIARNRVTAGPKSVADSLRQSCDGHAGGLWFHITEAFAVGIAPQFRIDRLQHIISAERATTYRRIHIIGFCQTQFAQHAFHRFVG